MNPSRLFVIAASLCCQLKSLAGDDESDNTVKQNLTFAICGLHSMLGLGHGGYSELDGMERFHEAFLLLDPKKGDYNFLRFKSIVDNRNSQADSPALRHVLISNLIKRMGKDTLEMEAFEMKQKYLAAVRQAKNAAMIYEHHLQNLKKRVLYFVDCSLCLIS